MKHEPSQQRAEARPGITLVGAAHIDRYGRCDGPPVAGGSNPGRFANLPGGAAFNVASSLSALGAKVRLQTILGQDAEAILIREAGAARGIDLIAQVSADHPTASYTSIVGPDGALAIALADMDIYAAFEAAEAPCPADDWLLVDANLAADAMAALLARAGGRTAAMTVSYAKAERVRPSLERIEFLFTNRVELAALCGAGLETPVAALLDPFRALGGSNAVITDGPADVWTVEPGAILRHPVPPAPRIVDVTGAGDALTAGCLSALMAGQSLAQAVPHGIRAAHGVLSVHGPWRADLAQS